MAVFLFYLAAICLFFALLAAITDFIVWVNPDWLQAEADESLEDSSTTREKAAS